LFELFLDIVPVMPFEDIETALEYIITSDHGQQVSIFSSDLDKIGALVDPLVNQVCRVNINCQCQRGPDVFPFTGRRGHCHA
jgi:glyceraldehyde-3-phosphate dehydrogenase (NADP+)